METVTPLKQADGLTQLLSRLPMELRLQIYGLSLPLIRHRKRRVDTAYVADISWIAASQPLFDEVGSHVFRESTLAFRTSLPDGSNLVEDFGSALDRAFSGQAQWTLARALPMLQIVKVTVKFARLYSPSNHLPGRLENYFRGMTELSNLRHLQISLIPETMLSYRDNFICRHGDCTIEHVQKRAAHLPFLNGLKRRITNIYACVPNGCHVEWRFDRTGMPEYSGQAFNKIDVVRYLELLNEYVGEMLAEKEAHAKMAAELAEACRRKFGCVEGSEEDAQ